MDFAEYIELFCRITWCFSRWKFKFEKTPLRPPFVASLLSPFSAPPLGPVGIPPWDISNLNFHREKHHVLSKKMWDISQIHVISLKKQYNLYNRIVLCWYQVLHFNFKNDNSLKKVITFFFDGLFIQKWKLKKKVVITKQKVISGPHFFFRLVRSLWRIVEKN